jgi:hypothetical protein
MKNMNYSLYWLLLLLPTTLRAQTSIQTTFPVQPSQQLVLDFDYPELVRISTWDKPEVGIRGNVSINRGENDNAFELKSYVENNSLIIRSIIRDKDNLPKRMLVKRGAEEIYFKTDNPNAVEVRNFMNDSLGSYQYMNTGVIMEIELEVFIPRGMKTKVNATYGMVEVRTCDAPLIITAPYGGADISVPAQGLAELKAKTVYGEIYTNLSQKPAQSSVADDYKNWTNVIYALGSGNHVAVESKYGNVYLRMAK